MSSPFAITTATSEVALSGEREGEISFTVSNLGERDVRGRAHLIVEEPASEAWLTLQGELARNFPVGGAEQYRVKIAVPSDAPTGRYSVRLDMIGVERPDEVYVEGPTVTFMVPAAEPSRRALPWIPLLIGLGILSIGIIAFIFWPRGVTIPEVAGLMEDEARATLEENELDVVVEPMFSDDIPIGHSIGTDPPVSELVPRGSVVTLFVSRGPEPAEFNGLQIALNTDRYTYEVGEEIPFIIIIENTSQSAVELEFGSTLQHDLRVERNDELIWQMSFGETVPGVVTNLTLEPESSREFMVRWEQQDNQGRQVQEGSYAAVGIIPAMQQNIESSPLEVHITRP